MQHSYNVLGLYTSVGGGSVVVSLMASTLNNASFAVGAASNLGVYVLPLHVSATSASLPADSQTLAFDVPASASPLPANVILSTAMPKPKSGTADLVAVLASGRVYQTDGPSHYGDAVWFVTNDKNTNVVYNNRTMHADNDMWVDAEAGNAPIYTHGLFPRATVRRSLGLAASAETWSFCCNKVHYRVGAATTIVAAHSSQVIGGVSMTSTVNVGNNYVCVGTSKAWPGCPPVGSSYALPVNGTVAIPQNHSGVVYFSLKTIVQADSSDVGGTVAVQIAIDGRRVGSAGVQQLRQPDCVSTRTLTASYLSSNEPLAPGPHTVQVLVDVDGSFIHLCLGKQLLLVWFG